MIKWSEESISSFLSRRKHVPVNSRETAVEARISIFPDDKLCVCAIETVFDLLAYSCYSKWGLEGTYSSSLGLPFVDPAETLVPTHLHLGRYTGLNEGSS